MPIWLFYIQVLILIIQEQFLTLPTGIIGLVLVNLTIKENVLLRDFYLLTLINPKSVEEVAIANENILRVADLLEQIQDVNRMIELHQGDDDLLMLHQYQYRRSLFLEELNEILSSFKIYVGDIAA